ncbi:hypothetical protein Q4Q52_19610 [Shewanella sp. SP1S2-4]|uniref:fascin domain-containing protein n=1 Tax=Shewanella sp. SP1S2-4 TaxID=3063537 RepID=UPI00288D4CA7|nr:hypothetical protein [Shewanella sp. SP1S2-4]MDT3321944.1 hypothetical protein [Shewanella sp. SP1S2-4]
MSTLNTSASNSDPIFPSTFPVMIRSNQFPQCLLRMSGQDSPQFNGDGFGTVNCQADQNDPDKNPWEIFNAIRNGDGTVSFESMAFPSNYLRMAGEASPVFNGNGFGTVNCQASIGPWEKFNVAVLSDSVSGVLTSIESNAFPSNYLRMAGEQSPSFNGAGFGTVNCQASVGPYEQFHLGAVLKESVETLEQWFPNSQPTPAQIEKLVAAIITGQQPSNVEMQATTEMQSFLTLTENESVAIEAIDLEAISPCTKSIATFCIDVLLLALQLASIRIMRTDSMVKAAVQALGAEAVGLERLITGISSASTTLKKATLIFQFISQLFNIGFIKGVIKTIVNGLSWFGAIVAAVSFIATVVAWISTDGVLLIAQIVLVGTGLAAIIADAVAVGTNCGSKGCNVEGDELMA